MKFPPGPQRNTMQQEKKEKKLKEPSIIIKPLGRFGGLDNLHLMLIIVIVLLFLLLFVVSYGKPITILANNTTGTCTNATAGANCAVPIHNATQIKALAERVLASYANVNSSLSLLPFISNVGSMNVSYLQASKSWYVQVGAKNFVNNFAFQVGFLINDRNISQITPLLQTAVPSQLSNNTVVATGVIKMSGRYACLTPTPTHVYWFVDPYAVGAVKSLLNASDIMQLYGSRVNLTVKVVDGADTQRVSTSVGLFNALYLSKYALCASQQENFSAFATNLNTMYNGSYMSQSVLAGIANESKLNNVQLNGCINATNTELGAQGLLAQYYNITQTPSVVVGCQYLTLPQITQEALCYTNSTLC